MRLTQPFERSELFTRSMFQPFQNVRREHSSRRNSKFKDFGEEEFIKKLHLNTTKKIDKKSVKAIQKYISELSAPKTHEIISPSLTNKLQRSGSMAFQLKERQANIENGRNEEEEDYDQSSPISYQWRQRNDQGKNHQQRMSNAFESETSIIGQKNLQEKDLSFRNNRITIDGQRRYGSTNRKKLDDQRDLRPTVDTSNKSKQTISMVEVSHWDRERLIDEVLRLRVQNEEQNEIIRLHEIMIEKMTDQLEKTNDRIYLSAKCQDTESGQNPSSSQGRGAMQNVPSLTSLQWEKELESLSQIINETIHGIESKQKEQMESQSLIRDKEKAYFQEKKISGSFSSLAVSKDFEDQNAGFSPFQSDESLSVLPTEFCHEMGQSDIRFERQRHSREGLQN